MTQENTLSREALHKALIIKEGTDFPFDDLQAMIKDLEMSSFGEYIHEEELRMIVEDGLGKVFLAFDGTQQSLTLISYQVVLFKEYGDKDSDIESRLQPLLAERRSTDNSVMHDDVHFDKDTTIYFHLIGTREGYDGMGISSRLKKEALARLTLEQREKKRKVCIRINNDSSMVVNMKVLGVIPASFKPIDHSMIGSRETNFNLETVEGVSSFFDSVQLKEWLGDDVVQVLDNDSEIILEKFLIPFNVGGQSDLEDGTLEQKLKKIMETHYIRGIFKAEDLDLDGDSYFYAEAK